MLVKNFPLAQIVKERLVRWCFLLNAIVHNTDDLADFYSTNHGMREKRYPPCMLDFIAESNSFYWNEVFLALLTHFSFIF
jgi:hypothetical protein